MLLCGILRLVVDAYVSAMSAINTREYSPCNVRIYLIATVKVEEKRTYSDAI
jgi:hypothetical protein